MPMKEPEYQVIEQKTKELTLTVQGQIDYPRFQVLDTEVHFMQTDILSQRVFSIRLNNTSSI